VPPVRVLHVPGGHGYVQNLQDETVTGVEIVPEPPVRGGVWAPSPALDAEWIGDHQTSFDVLHLHFGFESRTPAQLRAWLHALRDNGLVVTVHDLQNPHLTDQRPYADLLDVIVPAADAVITLTPGAAGEIERRWDRKPVVIPHPHLAPVTEIGRPRPSHEVEVVGLHLKSLRANLLALPALRVLLEAVERLPRTRLRVDVHAEALQQEFVRHDAELLRWLAGTGDRIDLRVHDRFDDADLVEYLRQIDVSVLAYAHGTHSGWLELCHDLGTPVLAGTAGYLAEQRPLVQVDLTDVEQVRTGLLRALAGFPGVVASPRGRCEERTAIARAHRDVYRTVRGAS
jgi:beta-1,4-mannosyltransferase